jgi:hypothetical protein
LNEKKKDPRKRGKYIWKSKTPVWGEKAAAKVVWVGQFVGVCSEMKTNNY